MRNVVVLLSALTMSVVFGGAEPIPLPEHPRPDWERADWINLNGRWDFASDADGKTNRFPLAITVPFGWAAPLSGVAKTAKDWNAAWYRREIVVPESWKGRRVFLVVGACDRETEFFLDDLPMGRHIGGYTPIEVDLTPFVKFGKKQAVRLRVDDSPNDRALTGKQGYGNARGIWQTVYLEARGEDWFDYVHFTPSIAKKSVRTEISLGLPSKAAQTARITFAGRTTEVPFAIGESEKSVEIPVDDPHLWTLDDPYLYDVSLELGTDRVSTYFGFREIGVGLSPLGDPYVTLNGKPHYLRLTLDQSYHPEGFYTFPTDEFMKNEILLSKKLGLDGNRVHIKVEVPRKLYWADKLGVLIQADVPNAWGHAAPEMFEAHRFCLEGMIKRDYNHPSIYQWTLFNESWGIFTPIKENGQRRLPDTFRRISQTYRLAKRLDPSRLVEDESACCFDHIETDVNSIHGYHTAEGWRKRLLDDLRQMKGEGSRWNYADGCRQRAMTPYMNSECGNVWGYKQSAGDSDWSWDYLGMMNTFRKHPKCAGWLYTEHHDVINEWNGYVRDDRTPRDPGYGALCPGMTFRDLHGDAVLSLDAVPGAKYACGETMKVPLDISLVSDAFTGRDFTVTAALRYLDREGRLVERPLPDAIRFKATRWQHGRIGEVAVTLPDSPAAGTVNFALSCEGRVLMRNFQAFACGTDTLPLLKPSSSQWSQKAFEVLDGQKQCGCGKGYFEYTVESSTEGQRFRAEVSPRPLMGRDVGGLEGPKSDLDMFRQGGWNNGGNYLNSYPMTCSVRHPTTVRVLVDGKLAKTVRLENDPADSQGILSHLAQRNDRILRETGTYGYLVEVPLGGVGRHVVRLETDEVGLAVYGPQMGRYPFGPEVAEASDRGSRRSRGAMLPHRPTEADLRDLAAEGANLVRYQMTGVGVPRPAKIETEDEELAFFDAWSKAYVDRLVDEVLPWSRKYGLKVVIDLHASPGRRDAKADSEVKMYHNARYARRFVDFWRETARRCQPFVDVIYGYDLFNEPQQNQPPLADCDYWTLQERAARAIREVDTLTPVIVSGRFWDMPHSFTEFKPFTDANVIYQAHMYAPHEFTHQFVADWCTKGLCAYPGVHPKTGSRLDVELLKRVLKPVRDFQLKHGARIFIGEFSAIAWAPGADRYLGDCISLFEEYGWDWTYHAWREWAGWSVEHDCTDFGKKDLRKSPVATDRQKVLRNGFRGVAVRTEPLSADAVKPTDEPMPAVMPLGGN